MITGFGNGKLILCGEHAVVYGHPALAMAVDRGTSVTLTPTRGPTRILSDIRDPRLERAILTRVPAQGFEVRIDTNLPIGRGMGSSAALSVALIRAVRALDGQTPSVDELYEQAFEIERVFHGNPSGLDHAVSARGGLLRYRRGPPPSFEPLSSPAGRWVVLDSGEEGNTAELVAGVASRRPRIDPILERIGALVHEAATVLDDPAKLGPLLNENHALLREIGVSNSRLDALIAFAREHGALGAKLAGAGGGGVVLALVADPHPLLQSASAAKIPAFEVAISPLRS